MMVSKMIWIMEDANKTNPCIGKVAMSVLTKGLAMDWEREGKTEMAISSIWPAVVS